MKSMKKSMFVTTILMVVLLIVALSTATFAWYTAQSSAIVNKTSIVAANSSSASLVIDYMAAASNTADRSEVSITMDQGISPMIYDATAAPVAVGFTEGTPVSNPHSEGFYVLNAGVYSLTEDETVQGGTTYYTANTPTALSAFTSKFVSFNVKNDGSYATTPASATPGQISSVTGAAAHSQTYFYVTNIGGRATNVTANITITAEYVHSQAFTTADTVSGTWYTDETCETEVTPSAGKFPENDTYYQPRTNDYLRVAMFVDDEYVGTWSKSGQTSVKFADYTNTASTHPEYLAEGHALLSESNYTAFTSAQTVKYALGSMGAMQVKLVAWFEGSSMTNDYAGTGASFTVSFNAA